MVSRFAALAAPSPVRLGHTFALSALAVSAVGGCFTSHDDSPSDDGRDMRVGDRDGGPLPVDAFVDDCPPFPGPPTPEIRISADEAECVGVTAPDCASCHTRPEGWVLRPAADGAPPIGGIDFSEIVAECIPDCRFD